MEPLKYAFSPALVSGLAKHMARHSVDFDPVSFEADVLGKLEELELKPRAQWIADCLHKHLPPEWQERARILRTALHPVSSGNSDDPTGESGLRGWAIMPLTMLVGQQHTARFDEAMALLKEMTRRFTSEFAVRYFLLADQTRALAIMKDWLSDDDEHVRRLVSEGTRPRLPWAMQLPAFIEDSAPVLPFLESLRDDPSEYVRRSVANHLNDIAKEHPDLIGDIATEWMKNAPQERQRLLRHASRTLIKQGHQATLKAFGLEGPVIEHTEITTETPNVTFGHHLDFRVTITSKSRQPQPVVIDYVIHFMKADGKQKPKVFKWTKATLKPDNPLTLQRRHPIRPITTRRYYSGAHSVSLRINGQDFGLANFNLDIP